MLHHFQNNCRSDRQSDTIMSPAVLVAVAVVLLLLYSCMPFEGSRGGTQYYLPSLFEAFSEALQHFNVRWDEQLNHKSTVQPV